ncbi:hypothetical protein SDC9_151831 [bioreactor metagenome]|uniref:Uncharacterized protein n=1 Tax=bioreactor metagenome TaxID=1076179 RepID=A0A645ET48_9ZZZZ
MPIRSHIVNSHRFGSENVAAIRPVIANGMLIVTVFSGNRRAPSKRSCSGFLFFIGGRTIRITAERKFCNTHLGKRRLHIVMEKRRQITTESIAIQGQRLTDRLEITETFS